MQVKAETKEGLREEKVPTPSTIEDLNTYIQSLIGLRHDHGTCVYAMSMAAEATFNFVAGQLGATGFQASCADLDFIRRTRMIKGPLIIFSGDDYIYPQYNFYEKANEWYSSIRDWQRTEAKKKLKNIDHVHKDVVAYWQELAK
jgi:4-hydroxyphenylpyruvate dioxygenase-like putative hemolysin